MDNTTRVRLGEEGTRIIRSIEDALDSAISSHGELIAFLPQARKDAGLSAVFGQGLFDQVSEVLGDLIQTRRRLVGTHRTCEAVARRVGYMGPPNQDKDPPDYLPMEMQLAQPGLRVVEAEQTAA